ncbi:MAG: hypothetical protein H6606_08590 [Flavobacteriales bacterium]|nr:hypothetical protein [Flavobacteriales bacterium]
MMPFAAFFLIQVFANNPELSQVRHQYEKAIENKAKAEALYESLESRKDLSPTLQGYKGVSRMLLAKFAFNPYTKWNHFKAGRSILEEAIQKDPKNPELRLLRISTQLNVPEILEYSDNIESDKKFLVSAYSGVADPELRKMIRYLLTSYKLVPESAFQN